MRRREIIRSSEYINYDYMGGAMIVAGNVAVRKLALGAECFMVGVRGFEPPTPSSRTKCATRLRHTPIFKPAHYTK